jgi:tetratricopeptide (TPR) repeat protein
MRKRGKRDPLSGSIELALDFGQFVSYGRMWKFVSDLEQVKEQVDALVDQGEAERAVKLYELFLAGIYEKAQDADDSGGCLGVFFESLFVSWIAARQKADRPAEETVREILAWMDNDDYGFCHAMHGEVARALDKAGFALFKGHFQNLFETAFAPFACETPRRIYDYPAGVRRPARELKTIYIAKGDVRSYIALCDRMEVSPQDCEKIAEMFRARRRIAEALEWVERGLSLERGRHWGNESSHSLGMMRRELLAKAGRTEEAFQMAWEQFQSSPCEYAYADLMKYVPKKDRERWHKKALETAKRTSLSGFIAICVKTKEWDILARRVDTVTRETLEGEGHYVMERAAKGLARGHALAAARVYAALGMRIVKAGKSKYYENALAHLRNAKKLAEKAGHTGMWLSLVDEVRTNHARKQSFMPDFEEIAAGRRPAPSSFEERARKRWKKQVAK